MIYITGDTHIPTDIAKLASKRFTEQKNLTRDDYLIICGDFGGVWDGSNEEKYWISWLEDKNFTTLFVDGNHENFTMLSEFETEDFRGGKVHRISDNIYHLMRGEVFTICDKKIFTFGGATSHDKEYRRDGKTWWSEELPAEAELIHARKRLTEHDNRVDIIITHCAPSSIQRNIAPDYERDILTDFFDELYRDVSYNHWYFGHYHTDCEIDEKHTAMFKRIIKA